jgi:hypothetical protein
MSATTLLKHRTKAGNRSDAERNGLLYEHGHSGSDNHDYKSNSSFVWLDESDGMREPCAVNLDAIQTVAKDKLSFSITHLSENRMLEFSKR